MGKVSDDHCLSWEVREIRALGRSESFSLAMLWRQIYPGRRTDAHRLVAKVARLREGGGRAWLLRCGASVAGYASVAPTPGLEGVYELGGFVDPRRRRQGLGKHLLHTVIDDLAGGEARQLYCPLASRDSPAAQFLLASGFYLEHVERYLILDAFDHLPPVRLGEGYGLKAYERAEAITSFRRLYDASFSGSPWYQPYETDGEVVADLTDGDDLLFLECGCKPIGFLWLRWPELDVAEIEPIGLLPGYRGRGLGRQLMLAGLHRAAAQGAQAVNVGVWRQNEAAASLYERLGFRETHSKLFLAHDLAAKGCMS